MASHIIGVLGKKRAGKDTFARRLVEAHGFTRLAFADALRDAALALDPIISFTGGSYAPGAVPPKAFRLSSYVTHFGWEKAKETDEVRRTLQNYGIAIRNLDPDFWVRVVMDKAAALPGPVVITDVRFPNEADAVDGSGPYLRGASATVGTTVRVSRPDTGQDADLHISETALDYYVPTWTIPNTGTVDDLHAQADRIVQSLGV